MDKDSLIQSIKDRCFKLCQDLYENGLADADDIVTPIEKRPYQQREDEIYIDIIHCIQDYESVMYDSEEDWDLNFDY